jgi:hypothetical protein
MIKRKSPRQKAVWIRSDVFRFSGYLKAQRVILNDLPNIVAAVLDLSPRGKYRIGRSVKTWPGLDAQTLVEAMHKLEYQNDYNLDQALNSALQRKRKISQTEIGRRLGLDAKTRAELGIRNIFAFDQGADERKEAARQAKIARDQARWQNRRDVYLANALTNTKPWEAEGICRRTWERRKTKNGRLDSEGSRRAILPNRNSDIKRGNRGATGEALAPDDAGGSLESLHGQSMETKTETPSQSGKLSVQPLALRRAV